MIVDAVTVLSLAVLGGFFEAIAGWDSEVSQLYGGVEDGEFLPCGAADVGWDAALACIPEMLGVRVTEGDDSG